MPNSFNEYTPQQIAEVALGLVESELRLAKTVQRFGPNDYREGRGDTVFLNVSGALTAHSRSLDDTTNAIILDSLSETQEPVSLDVHAYSAVALSEADLTLSLTDFGRQVLAPQTDAVAAKLESAVARVLAGVTPTDFEETFDETDPVRLFTAGRAAPRARGVDVAAESLVAVVGANIVDVLLDSGALDYGKTGESAALRGGSLGRIRGFESIESSSGVGADEIVFMPKSGVYLAHRPPVVPLGASFGQTVSKDGLGLRYLRDYDPAFTRERSLVSTFVGAGIMPLYRVTRTDDTNGKVQGDAGYVAGSATVTRVPGDAVVKFDVSA